MKTVRIIFIALALMAAVPSFAKSYRKVLIPQKGKTSDPVTSPKLPSQSFVYVSISDSLDELTFEFSQDIQALFVVMTAESIGERQVGAVDSTDPTMSVTMQSGKYYLINCTADTGDEFETLIQL